MATFDTIRFKLLNLKNTGVAEYLVKGDRVTLGGMHFKQVQGFLLETKVEEFAKGKLTSASYDVNYELNLTQDCAAFEFSIPKYLYGHNLDHFPLNKGDEHLELTDFIVSFFEYEFSIKIEKTNVVILRLDLCHNYEFQSVENKEALKSVLPLVFNSVFGEGKTLRYSNNNTIMYYTQDYSFKIYDKGEEFLQHDFKKLEKSIGLPQAFEHLNRANRILRAELTFRKRKISYDYFANIELCQNVSPDFKTRFRRLQKIYNRANLLIDSIAKYCNQYFDDVFNYDSLVNVLKQVDQRAKKDGDDYFRTSATTYAIVAQKAKGEMNGDAFKKWTGVTVKEVLMPHILKSMKLYNSIVAPKEIRLELTRLDKAFIRASQPNLIEFNPTTLQILLDKFKTVFNQVMDFSASTLSPLQVLQYAGTTLKPYKTKLPGFRKYLIFRQTLSDKTIVQKGLISSATIRRYKALMREIDEVLKQHYPDKNYTLNSFDVPEKMSI